MMREDDDKEALVEEAYVETKEEPCRPAAAVGRGGMAREGEEVTEEVGERYFRMDRRSKRLRWRIHESLPSERQYWRRKDRANFERRASKSAKSVNNATKEQDHCCPVDQHIASKEQREVNISVMIMR
jgi:hypothetical protein